MIKNNTFIHITYYYALYFLVKDVIKITYLKYNAQFGHS